MRTRSRLRGSQNIYITLATGRSAERTIVGDMRFPIGMFNVMVVLAAIVMAIQPSGRAQSPASDSEIQLTAEKHDFNAFHRMNEITAVG